MEVIAVEFRFQCVIEAEVSLIASFGRATSRGGLHAGDVLACHSLARPRAINLSIVCIFEPASAPPVQ
jgi:hypothetical protein